MCAASSAFAGFSAGDLVIVPVIVHALGSNDSVWRTDVHITNVSEDPIDVCLYFFPNTLSTNAGYLNRAWGVGGREEEGFGVVDERLADIPAKATVILKQPLNEYWNTQLELVSSKGAMAVFAYAAGTLDDPDGRQLRNVIVNSYTYNDTTIWIEDPDNEGEFIEQAATYGQTIPGVPWYNLADGGFGDYAIEYLVGGIHTDDKRFNLGIFNSSDPQTTITMYIDFLDANGENLVGEDDAVLYDIYTMPPLSHFQVNEYLSLLGLEDLEGITIRLALVQWETQSPNPVPTFTSYGTVVDNYTNDGMTILPSFGKEFDVDCQFVDDGDEGAAKVRRGGERRLTQRPFDIPSF